MTIYRKQLEKIREIAVKNSKKSPDHFEAVIHCIDDKLDYLDLIDSLTEEIDDYTGDFEDLEGIDGIEGAENDENEATNDQ